MADIKDVLDELNPWWKGGFSIGFKEREIHKEIGKFMPLPQIIALTGLRRVGKTTLMLKAVEDAIKSGFNPRDIIYFSFDEFREVDIRDVIKEYERIMDKEFREGRRLLLLDEIQKLNGWEDNLKGIYDAYGKNTKIMISGSESLFIKKKSKETLAGRIFEFKVETLAFREFLGFKGADFEPINLHEKELSRMFNEFILTMGFPELVGIKEKNIIKKYIKEGIIEKILYKDIPRMYKIKDISAIESLLGMIVENPGQLIEISALAKDLKISRQTLSNYLEYLEMSFLLRKLYNFSRNKKKVERKLRKYYPTVISADLLFNEDAVSRSKVFEWMIVEQLKAEFFWRDPYKNEVDIVLADKELIPVEIKYGRMDFDGILAFMKKFKVGKGYIISPNKEEIKRFDDKTVYVASAFKFLLR